MLLIKNFWYNNLKSVTLKQDYYYILILIQYLLWWNISRTLITDITYTHNLGNNDNDRFLKALF